MSACVGDLVWTVPFCGLKALHSRSPTTTQNTASLQQLNSLPQNGVLTDYALVELSFSSKGVLANLAAMLFAGKTRQYVATEARSLKQKCDAMPAS